MPSLFSITRFLDEILRIRDIADSSNNGLQVGKGGEIFKVAFAVDACLDAFEKAKKAGANLVVVHHGISWKDSLKYLTDFNYKRINFLMSSSMALYAAHLPLDKHNDYGNNVQLFRLLKLKNTKPFGEYEGDFIGYSGEFEKEMEVEEVAAILKENLGSECKILKFGREKIRTAAVVSGRAAECLAEAVQKGVDVLITGEVVHESYHTAKDGGINVIAAGHYKTETLGVKALMPLVQQKFNIPTVFIESDTGM
ncbi:Nif3-like dinuclear metal center hexameric protein [Candidatus Woesearchaeota archaeon]|nr:Nif3-like dinuclear metal center hexameric protein [Candidatus Woesearchaeota archaeon]